MTYIFAILGTVAAYVLLALLLLSLNTVSLWRWWIKAGAILVTAAAFAGSYVAIMGLLGWPAPHAMPPRFSLLAAKVVEPDKMTGAAGHIYMWIEEINLENLPSADPRAFVVAYSDKLADALRAAQERLRGGEQVLGEMLAEEKQTATLEGGEEVDAEANSDRTGQGGDDTAQLGSGDATSQLGAAQGALTGLDVTDTLQLSVMPAPMLPKKPE